jgi:hypothetical protein
MVNKPAAFATPLLVLRPLLAEDVKGLVVTAGGVVGLVSREGEVASKVGEEVVSKVGEGVVSEVGEEVVSEVGEEVVSE